MLSFILIDASQSIDNICHSYGSGWVLLHKGNYKTCIKMVEKKIDSIYPLAYRLMKLSLILAIATTSAERGFSTLNIGKNKLRNKMRGQWLNDSC